MTALNGGCAYYYYGVLCDGATCASALRDVFRRTGKLATIIEDVERTQHHDPPSAHICLNYLRGGKLPKKCVHTLCFMLYTAVYNSYDDWQVDFAYVSDSPIADTITIFPTEGFAADTEYYVCDTRRCPARALYLIGTHLRSPSPHSAHPTIDVEELVRLKTEYIASGLPEALPGIEPRLRVRIGGWG